MTSAAEMTRETPVVERKKTALGVMAQDVYDFLSTWGIAAAGFCVLVSWNALAAQPMFDADTSGWANLVFAASCSFLEAVALCYAASRAVDWYESALDRAG